MRQLSGDVYRATRPVGSQEGVLQAQIRVQMQQLDKAQLQQQQ